jgi:hypothetical protein
MFACAVLEEIVDAPALRQALEEREVTLVELDLIVTQGIALDQALVQGKVVVRQQLFKDLNNCLVLENLALAGERCQVQPWAQRELVLNVTTFFAPQRRIGDQGADLTHADADLVDRSTYGTRQELARAIELDVARDLSPNEPVEIEVHRTAGTEVQSVGGLEHQFVLEEAIDAFAA